MSKYWNWQRKNFYRAQLENLADLLDALPPDRFDYDRFVGCNWQGKDDLSCGTTACAFGWAATMPIMKLHGLRLRAQPCGPCAYAPRFSFRSSRWRHAYDVARVAFALNFDENKYLFVPGVHLSGMPRSPGMFASAQDVAAHIRNFLNCKLWPGEEGYAERTP